jgi:hypothetical protein
MTDRRKFYTIGTHETRDASDLTADEMLAELAQ